MKVNNFVFLALPLMLTTILAHAQFDSPETAVAAGTNIDMKSIQTVDYTNNGNIDLLGRYSNVIALYENTGEAHFTSPEILVQATSDIIRYTNFDVNNDGNIDILSQTAAGISLYTNDGSELMLAQTIEGTFDRFSTFDIDGDGFHDLIAVDGIDLFVYLNDGSGGLVFHGSVDVYAAFGLEWGVGNMAFTDVNGDDHIDIVFTHHTAAGALLNDGDQNFTTYEELVAPTGIFARGVQAVDFDLDSDEDLVFLFGGVDFSTGSCGSAESLMLLLDKTGEDSYTESNLGIQTKREFTQLHISDMNGDGYPDIVADYYYQALFSEQCETYISGVQIMLNNGDGTASNQLYHSNSSPFGFDIPYIPGEMAMADLTGNGYDDMAFGVTNLPHKGPGYLVNSGSGSADLSNLYYANPGSETMALFSADMTGDGQTELVQWHREIQNDYLTYYSQGDYSESSVKLTSQGSLSPIYADVQKLVAVGDISGDGTADGVFVRVTGPGQREVVAEINNGDGSYSEEIVMMTEENIRVFTADLSNDGKDEVVVVTRNTNNHEVALYTRSGGGNYQALSEGFNIPGKFTSMSFGDVNGDGIKDISSVKNENSIIVSLSDGSGGSTGLININLPGASGMQHELSDFNGDGFADLVTWKASGTMPISYLQNSGGSSFATGVDIMPANSYKRFVTFGDLNNNGVPQPVFLSSNDQVVWIENDGNGNLGDEVIIADGETAATATNAVIGDFTGDGTTDVAIARAIDNLLSFNFEVLVFPGADISGCSVDGGTITALSATTVCGDDGAPSVISFSLQGAQGSGGQWVVLNSSNTEILAVANNPGWNFDNFESGTYAVAHASHAEGVNLAEVSPQNLPPCVDASNLINVTVENCTGFLEMDAYPNPSIIETEVYILPMVDGSAKLEVFDLAGRSMAVIFQGFFTADQEYRFNYQTSHLAPGIYLLRLTQNGQVTTRKILKE